MVRTTTDALKGTLTGNAPGGISFESFGTVTLNGVTPQTIVDTGTTAGDIVLFGLQTVGGTVSPAGPAVLTMTTGVGFTVGGTASDTSTYTWTRFTATSQQT